jgi:hypothetical protein
MEEKAEHHGREHLSTAVGLIAEYIAVVYGVTVLAWAAAFFVCLAAFGYTQNTVPQNKKLGWGIRVAAILLTLVIAIFLTLPKKHAMVANNETPSNPPPHVEAPKKPENKSKSQESKPKSKRPTETPPPVTQVCPQGNCIGGDNYGNPTVNNFSPPLEIKWETRDIIPPALSEEKHIFQYEKQVTVKANMTYTPVSLAIVCNSEIEEVNAGSAGAATHLNPRFGIDSVNKKVGFAYFEGTPITPDNPLYISVWSNRPFTVLEVRQARFNAP